jgi:hypothetical protein
MQRKIATSAILLQNFCLCIDTDFWKIVCHIWSKLHNTLANLTGEPDSAACLAASAKFGAKSLQCGHLGGCGKNVL